MTGLSKIFLFRMTHLQNIPHILQYGLTHINSPNRNPQYVPIGDSSLIGTRGSFLLPNGTRPGDYIPFYFGPRMPMLYVIQKGFNGVRVTRAADIVYCITTVASIHQQQGLDYIFSNGHAIDGFTSFYYPADIQNIETLIDRKAIKSKYWKDENDLDLKRRKEAEFLVLGDIQADTIVGFAVFSIAVQQQIQGMPGMQNKKLIVKPEYYF